jgi:hypothetical protein
MDPGIPRLRSKVKYIVYFNFIIVIFNIITFYVLGSKKKSSKTNTKGSQIPRPFFNSSSTEEDEGNQ